MKKGGGEEARSVRCMCDVCAAHGDRAAVGVDVDAQGSSLREGETGFPLNARVECRTFVSNISKLRQRVRHAFVTVFIDFLHRCLKLSIRDSCQGPGSSRHFGDLSVKR